MNTSKKITVNYSSLVGLKAELLRKQTEVKDAKVKAEVVQPVPKNKPKVKKPVMKIENKLIDTDDIKAHRKSKLMLEAKARLYENLKKTRSNKHDHFLVDFQSKSESEDEINSDDYQEATSDPEDDWVEYKDCFGRTRKCLRRDLPRMQEKDDFVKQEVMKKSSTNERLDEPEERSPSPPIIPKEPEIEMMRKKWEEQTEKLTEKMNIHYQDVLFDEARTHGVGYYAFSQDEEQRAKQQEKLDSLRKETLQKQKEAQDLREMKIRMEQNRLKAARIRQRIRAGLPPEPTEEEPNASNITETTSKTETEQDVEPNVEQHKEKETDKKDENPLAVIEDKIKAFGEMLGKRTQWREMSQEEWVHKRRKDRIDEFAPEYDNFKSAGYLEREKARENIDLGSQSASDRLSPNNDENPSDADRAPQGQGIHTNTNIDDTIDKDSDSNSSIIGPLPLNPEPVPNVEQMHPPFLGIIGEDVSNIDFSQPPPDMIFRTSSNTWPVDPALGVPMSVPPVNFYQHESVNSPVHSKCSSHPIMLNSNDILNSEQTYSSLPSSDTSDSNTSRRNLSEDTIAAGLKYLRTNFEQQKPV